MSFSQNKEYLTQLASLWQINFKGYIYIYYLYFTTTNSEVNTDKI